MAFTGISQSYPRPWSCRHSFSFAPYTHCAIQKHCKACDVAVRVCEPNPRIAPSYLLTSHQYPHTHPRPLEGEGTGHAGTEGPEEARRTLQRNPHHICRTAPLHYHHHHHPHHPLAAITTHHTMQKPADQIASADRLHCDTFSQISSSQRKMATYLGIVGPSNCRSASWLVDWPAG